MIRKTKIGKNRPIKHIEFGTGDIEMVGTDYNKEANHVLLAFKQQEEGNEINVKKKPPYKDLEEMKADLIFTFSREDSIDSLINMLIDCKTSLVKNKTSV